MVRFYESRFSYEYSFPAVTLAYFLRYPNPYSTHVLSTDVISRHLDPQTGRLHTVRLHLKRSKIPTSILRLLPKSVSGSSSSSTSTPTTPNTSAGGPSGQSFILETSTVDMREGWMETETRNLEWTGVLSVVEKQTYKRPTPAEKLYQPFDSAVNVAALAPAAVAELDARERTDVKTVVSFRSRLGQGKARHRAAAAVTARTGTQEEHGAGGAAEEEAPAKKGFFSSWSTASLQRSIELVGMRRTGDHAVKSKEGMKIVLERLREGGLVGVLEGMRQDRERAYGGGGGGQAGGSSWSSVWRRGGNGDGGAERRRLDYRVEDE